MHFVGFVLGRDTGNFLSVWLMVRDSFRVRVRVSSRVRVVKRFPA